MIDLNKLNKIQIGIIISSALFLISMLGFMFNSRVRISRSYIEVPDIVIEEPIEIDNVEPSLSYDDLFRFIIMLMIPLVMFKLWGMLDDF